MIAVFNQTLMAMRFYDAVLAKGIDIKIVPTPRRYSVSCGLACRFPDEEIEDLQKMCEQKRIQVAAYHDDDDE